MRQWQMSIDFAARQLFSGDLENAPLKLSDMFNELVEGLMSFPLNIPGTAHHKCLKVTKTVFADDKLWYYDITILRH